MQRIYGDGSGKVSQRKETHRKDNKAKSTDRLRMGTSFPYELNPLSLLHFRRRDVGTGQNAAGSINLQRPELPSSHHIVEWEYRYGRESQRQSRQKARGVGGGWGASSATVPPAASPRARAQNPQPIAAAHSLHGAMTYAKLAIVKRPPSPALVGGLRGSQPAASRHGGKGRGSLLPSNFASNS
jgi:hypothetical protein